MSQSVIFKLKRYRDWESEIESCILAFISIYGDPPNVLIANKVTLSRFEIFFAIGLIGNEDYVGTPSIGSLDWGIADTRLAIDDTLEDREFELLRVDPPEPERAEPEAPRMKIKAGSRS